MGSIDGAYKYVCVPIRVPKGRFCMVIGAAGAIVCPQYNIEKGICGAGFKPLPLVQGMMVEKPEECYDLPALLSTDQ